MRYIDWTISFLDSTSFTI